MAALNIPIGVEFFREMREKNYYYIDKTSFLEEMLGTSTPKVSLFTRPRRFGKTLMLSMLQEFFDINGQDRNLFEGLIISQNKALCAAWMHQYPTVFLTFKDIRVPNFSRALEKYAALIKRLILSRRDLLASDRLFEDEKEDLKLLQKREVSISILEDSLLTLCRALEHHHGKPVILLIDEYDTPINCSEKNGYYKAMIDFMRNVLSAALKTNPSLKFAVLTGCLRIAKESIFTGLNNFKCFGISESSFADKFGFTEAEVDTLLSDAGMFEKKVDIKEWYDGYRFGRGTAMYCPWDVLQYVDDLQRDPMTTPQAYWKNTSSNDIVRTLAEKSGKETRRKIEDLLAKKPIEERLEEDLNYDLLYKKDRSLITMLYLTGYLTKAKTQPDNGSTRLVIPNKEIQHIFIDQVSEWFEDSLNSYALKPFIDALWRGDCATVQKALRQILYGTISFYDSVESFYHGFLAGLIRGYDVNLLSNRENGLGRSDITLEDELNDRVIIIEVKRTQCYSDLEKMACAALAQIEEKKYAEGLSLNFKTVLKYGISFCKKECCVKVLLS